MNDRDWYSLSEPKAKKFFRNAVNGVKGTVNFAKKLHAKRVALEKAQDYHEAQRRAKCFKEWKYVQALELHRDKMKNFPELGLKLGDFIFESRGKRLIAQEKLNEKVVK